MNIEFISDKFEFLFNNQIITQHILIDYWLLNISMATATSLQDRAKAIDVVIYYK